MGKTVEVYGFPSGVTADVVRSCLEGYVGNGSIVALKVRSSKTGGRYYAIVQFKTESDASKMVTLNQRIYYGSSYLKVRHLNEDIIAKPRIVKHDLEDVTVYFGYQSSPERFTSLWRSHDAEVKIDAELKKWQFFLSVGAAEYRLDFPKESIWKVELHRVRSRLAKYVVIQLEGAPRIYERDSCAYSGTSFDNPLFNFFLYGSDDQWVRTTDFTSSCLGHSSALCLQFPFSFELPEFERVMLFYSEIDGSFDVENGGCFSRNRELVPIVDLPAGVNLPYEIFFRVNILVQRGCLPGSALDARFYKLIDPSKFDVWWIEQSLEKLLHLRECCYDPCKWLIEQYTNYSKSGKPVLSPSIKLDDGLVYVHRVQITPSKVYFFGPEINSSNRVLREFKDHIENFLRVSFVDEELRQLYSMDLSSRNSNGQTAIYRRVLSVVRNGITIGDKRFEFLAFSSSQLRENSCWMFAPTSGVSAASIRRWLGDFSKIRNVAKYAARLGQSFSASKETFSVPAEEVEFIPDIKVQGPFTEYVFSDGIGKISAEFARKIARKCGFGDQYPSAFQIRYAGCKGVVAIDPESRKMLSLRESMRKFDSENTKLDVLAHSKYQPCYLNRQLITLLSTLGVQDSKFERKQKEAIRQLDSILSDASSALSALDLIAPGENTNVLKELLLCGYQPNDEPYLKMMLQTIRAGKLHDLRIKARIFIPDGRAMMGCLDETRTLEYGEVFVQVSSTNRNQSSCDSTMNFSSFSDHPSVITGRVIVAKNPCLHPGDIRVLTAVDVPALHHMFDCLVFPQKGPRPHTNECSGSDLDGDVYFVCWDADLMPLQLHRPMDYTPPAAAILDHEVTVEEIAQYFTDYIVNYSLGVISNAHTAFADQEPLKALSPKCCQLAKLFAVAVDFPKTGVPAVLPPSLRAKEFPDFMEKPDKPAYASKNVIGKLFREVKEISHGASSIEPFTLESSRRSYDPDMEVAGFLFYVDDAAYYKNMYDYKLGNLMEYYGIRTEAEILSGNILKFNAGFDHRKDYDSIRSVVQSLRKEARAWFNEGDNDDENAKASAWYHVTYHFSFYGSYNEGLKRPHFISFPWCVYDKLVEIKRKKVAVRARSSRVMELFRELRV